MSGQTVYNWRKQELIDTGQVPGLSTVEQTELTAARRRIWTLGWSCPSMRGRCSGIVNRVLRSTSVPIDAFLLPSQLLTPEVLRRPLEFILVAGVGVGGRCRVILHYLWDLVARLSEHSASALTTSVLSPHVPVPGMNLEYPHLAGDRSDTECFGEFTAGLDSAKTNHVFSCGETENLRDRLSAPGAKGLTLNRVL